MKLFLNIILGTSRITELQQSFVTKSLENKKFSVEQIFVPNEKKPIMNTKITPSRVFKNFRKDSN